MIRCIEALLVSGNGKHCTGVFFPTAAYSLCVFYTKFPINCVSLRPSDSIFIFAYDFFSQFPQKLWSTEHNHSKITLHNNYTHIYPLHQKIHLVCHLLFTSQKPPFCLHHNFVSLSSLLSLSWAPSSFLFKGTTATGCGKQTDCLFYNNTNGIWRRTKLRTTMRRFSMSLSVCGLLTTFYYYGLASYHYEREAYWLQSTSGSDLTRLESELQIGTGTHIHTQSCIFRNLSFG